MPRQRPADRLEQTEHHFWEPVEEVVRWIENTAGPDARVLEIGPGHNPFWRADEFVDFVDVPGIPPSRMHKLDIATQPLPFADKSFDYVVCRHTLEDMYNPFPVMREMSRVARAGYIETPSPIAELCRGVDGGGAKYCGYHHHRFIAWNDGGTLKLITKYPLVEHVTYPDLADHLRGRPKYWNTYYTWEGEVSFKHVQSPLDFDMGRDYFKILKGACEASAKATDTFWESL